MATSGEGGEAAGWIRGAAKQLAPLALLVMVLGGCGHATARWLGPPPGESQRPYAILPEYLVEPVRAWSAPDEDREGPQVPVSGQTPADRAPPPASAPRPPR